MKKTLKRLPELINILNSELAEYRSYFTNNLHFITKHDISDYVTPDGIKVFYDRTVEITADLVSDLNNLIEEIDDLEKVIRENYEKLVDYFGKGDFLVENEEGEVKVGDKIDAYLDRLEDLRDESEELLELIDFYVYPKIQEASENSSTPQHKIAKIIV